MIWSFTENVCEPLVYTVNRRICLKGIAMSPPAPSMVPVGDRVKSFPWKARPRWPGFLSLFSQPPPSAPNSCCRKQASSCSSLSSVLFLTPCFSRGHRLAWNASLAAWDLNSFPSSHLDLLASSLEASSFCPSNTGCPSQPGKAPQE